MFRRRSDGYRQIPTSYLAASLSARKKKGPIGPLLFLKAIEVDEEPLGFDQTRP